MKKPFKIAIVGAVVLLVLIQLVPVDRSNPPIVASGLEPAGEVGDVLRAACYDCHSHETVWPWYSKVAPVSFFVASHVEEGREHLNFSTWGQDDLERRDHKLEELIEMVEEGEMPLRSYTLGHPEARLTEAQRELLVDWARARRVELGVGAADGGDETGGDDDDEPRGGEHRGDG